MDNKDNNSFMDSKTLIAIALVAVVWFGWQKYLSSKYPNMNNPIAADASKAPSPGTAAPSTAPNTALSNDVSAKDSLLNKNAASTTAPETTFDVADDSASFKISSAGMGLKNFQLKQYTKRDHSPIEFAPGLPAGLFELSLIGQDHALPMQVTKQNDNTYVGVAQVGAATITRTMVYNSKSYSFDNEVVVTNAGPDFHGISLLIPEKKEEVKSSGFLSGNYEHQEYYLAHSGNKTDRVNVSSAKEDIQQSFANLSVVGVSSQYFATAVVDKSEIVPVVDLVSTHAGGDFSARLNYNITSAKDKMTFTFKSFAGPKGHDVLAQVDPALTDIVNFGMFGAIGKILLVVLKYFYSIVGNWGWSIILLTLLVRLLVLPVNLASFKSMKRMKVIQPMMQGLREKYKDDPASLQRETMALMKREKVNPLGGCLPMLLQMPIFFALFQVLGHSIELYQAPFFGWITDLSLKDPIYVMPVLIGIVFFIQQKITPTTMDPAQAKVMQFMPIMFAFMMLSLPSGLTIYTFISTLFGITQQRIFMRDKNSAKEVTPARA